MEKRKDALQWHPAFYADIQIEFREEAHKLKFQNEYALSKKPMLIDILAIRKKAGEKIHKNIGRIFRTYNLIEYKSPKDYMSVDDFYKVYGYACFYKADTGQMNEIPAEEITITFVSKNYPRKMIRHLEDTRKYRTEKKEAGIYYVEGDVIAIQIIVTSQLSPEENLWLYSLTDNLTDPEVTERLLADYNGKEQDNLYSAVMQVVVQANEKQFQGGENMCDALRKIIDEEVDKRVEEVNQRIVEEFDRRVAREVDQRVAREVNKRVDREVAEKEKELLTKGREAGLEAGRQEGCEQMGISIRNLVEVLKITVDQAMDLLKVKDEEREKYRILVQHSGISG